MTPDVIIVGAGVMGASLARRLSADGLATLICGWEAPERDSSWAAAGMLCAQVEAHEPGPFLDLLVAAEARWVEFDGRFDYRREGALQLALDDRERKGLLRQREWQVQRGLPVELLEPEEIGKLEPGVSREVTGASFFPRGGQVDNRALVAGLLADAEVFGARRRSGRVDEVLVEKSRVRGVRVEGERLEAGVVAVAAGAWTDAIKGLGIASSVPVRGQLIALPACPVTRPVFGGGGYVLPKGGACVCGTTMERVGFDARVTAQGKELLLRRARRLCPSLGGTEIAAAWAGLRPATADGLPAFGPTPIEGLHLAVGLFRNGILLAPLAADLMARAIEGDADVVPEPFRASRLFV